MARIINIKALDVRNGDSIYLSPNGMGYIQAGIVTSHERIGTTQKGSTIEFCVHVNGDKRIVIASATDTLLGYRKEA